MAFKFPPLLQLHKYSPLRTTQRLELSFHLISKMMFSTTYDYYDIVAAPAVSLAPGTIPVADRVERFLI